MIMIAELEIEKKCFDRFHINRSKLTKHGMYDLKVRRLIYVCTIIISLKLPLAFTADATFEEWKLQCSKEKTITNIVHIFLI